MEDRKAFPKNLKENEDHDSNCAQGGSPDQNFCNGLSKISPPVEHQLDLLRESVIAKELRIIMMKKRITPVAKRACRWSPEA
jgi:hypothetical protein